MTTGFFWTSSCRWVKENSESFTTKRHTSMPHEIHSVLCSKQTQIEQCQWLSVGQIKHSQIHWAHFVCSESISGRFNWKDLECVRQTWRFTILNVWIRPFGIMDSNTVVLQMRKFFFLHKLADRIYLLLSSFLTNSNAKELFFSRKHHAIS